jgi:hypothetical protein
MGAGLPLGAAVAVVNSLNGLFYPGQNIHDLKSKYKALQGLYPTFMSYRSLLADGSNRHDWRKSTLRYAGWLLTSEIILSSSIVPGTPDYPGQTFIKWLKWLTWIQTFGAGSATVTVVPALPTGSAVPAPAEAILNTLTLALNDPNDNNSVSFQWTQGSQLIVAVNQTPGQYAISVTSVNADDPSVNASDDDEDKHL